MVETDPTQTYEMNYQITVRCVEIAGTIQKRSAEVEVKEPVTTLAQYIRKQQRYKMWCSTGPLETLNSLAKFASDALMRGSDYFF